MKYENLLILGASGGCGRWVVQLANERGHHVTAVVRSAASCNSPEGVAVVEGNVLDVDAVEQAMQGQDAVVSCLGIRRKTPANPWSAVVPPVDFTSQSARNIVRAMKKHVVRRVVAISAAGVGDSWRNVSPVMKFLIRSSNIAVSYRDMAEMEEVYRQADIDSLVVRPVGLVNDDQSSNRTTLVERFRMSSRIARRDVAEWMLDAVERPEPFEISAEMIGWS